MKKKTIVYVLFAIGVFLLAAHTTLAVLWQLLTGLPDEYPLGRGPILYYAQGFSPILGVLTLLIAGLIYEKLESPA